MVQERISPSPRMQCSWKLPGGLAEPGEDYAQTNPNPSPNPNPNPNPHPYPHQVFGTMVVADLTGLASALFIPLIGKTVARTLYERRARKASF